MKSNPILRFLIVLGIALAVQPALAKEYILTAARPNLLVLADPAKREVVKSFEVPDAGSGISTVVPSPDGRIAYVVTNRWESVAGIDLDSGEQVFRADFSTPQRRVKAVFAMDVSPDGQEMVVLQSPVQLKRDHYEVEDVYAAVYRTDAGVGAQPARRFSIPRRTALLAYSEDGSKLYAIGWNIEIYDPATGQHIGTHALRHWQRPNYSEPDVLDVWPQWEQASMFTTPYYAVRTDLDPSDPAAYKTGLVTLDLVNDRYVTRDFEDTAVVIFSSVMNPVRRNEVYGVYTQLSKIDADKGSLLERINLDHTYYSINVSGDGRELYLAGTMDDIAIYDSASFRKLGEIRIPGGGDMALASIRIINR